MIFSSVFLVLALGWSVFVTSAVLQSAAVGATQIVAFERVMYTPQSVEESILLLCAMSASAALALVTGIYMVRGRRLERRMAAELEDRMATRLERDAEDSAVPRLLEHRVTELQTSVDTLTAQRDAIYDEIRGLRESRTKNQVVTIADAAETVDAVIEVPETSDDAADVV